jgi:hypothetical protein
MRSYAGPLSCPSIAAINGLSKGFSGFTSNPAQKALSPALVSIQCNPMMIAFYNRLKEKGKNGKVIVCAIMRKLVHVIFGVLKSGKKYDPNYKPILA